MIRQVELAEKVRAYNSGGNVDDNEALLDRAYVFAMRAHGNQRRDSGDPYFLHPLEVASILADLRLDIGSVITGLLHDTVEDTEATLEEIGSLFGAQIAQLVDGVTKLSKLELAQAQDKQAENFRKLVLAMSKDIRVLLVKLADRLHNMRTLDGIKSAERRRRIARETLDIYAPLADRIGMHHIKDELEDLAFTQLNPEARESVLKRMAFLDSESGDVVERTIDSLSDVLKADGLKAKITGRRKRPFSIWRKMEKKRIEFGHLSDVVAFRVIVDDIAGCYRALGLIHGAYAAVPERFKDYISTAKPNGYQSIHTTVMGPSKTAVEVQIRTEEMHEFAEFGVAAHWAYKQGGPATDLPNYRWINELLSILDDAQRPDEFLEHTKLELFQDQVFCFTPKSQVIALPRNATPIDFAYAVHSEVGDRCVGAKVNGRMVNLRHRLQNGDQVEVVTSKTSTPSPSWERIAVTGKARARIRRHVRQKQRGEHVQLGKGILQKEFRRVGKDYSEKNLEPALTSLKAASIEDVFAAVGAGLMSAREIVGILFPEDKEAAQKTEKIISLDRARSRQASDPPIPIKGLIPGMALHYARCCHPIPGDRIVGIVTTGKGVTIHTIDCETLESFYDTPERWLDVEWGADTDNSGERVARLYTVVTNEPGALGVLSTVIGRNGGNITNLKITSRSTDFFEMLIDVSVTDTRHLANIIAALRATPQINDVDRARTG